MSSPKNATKEVQKSRSTLEMLTTKSYIGAAETGIAETLGNQPVIINAEEFDEERLRLIASTSKSQLSADGG